MSFSCADADGTTIESVIDAVGLRPIFGGPDEEKSVDCLVRLSIVLAMTKTADVTRLSVSSRAEPSGRTRGASACKS